MKLDWEEINRLVEQCEDAYYDELYLDEDDDELMTQAPYGAEINMSYVTGEDGYHLGVHMTDSEGLDVSSEVEGDDLISVLYAAMQEIYSGMHNATQQSERDKEIQQLRADIGNIQQRLDNLLNN